MKIVFGNIRLATKYDCDKFLSSIYLFILIFAPPIIPYPYLFLIIYSLFLLVTEYRGVVFKVLKNSGIYNWIVIMAILAVYTVCLPLPISMLCNDIVNTSHYISVINRYGVLIVAVSICVTYLLCKMDRDGYDYEFLMESLINAGLIEGICASLAFLFPGVKSIFIFFMKRFSASDLYSNTWYITVRSYGFASTLVDVFGLGAALIAGICFFYGITRKKKYIVESIVIAIATILNSRTGLLVYLIAIVLSLLYVSQKGDVRKIISSFVAIGILVIVGSKILEIMSTNEYTAGWFQAGIKSIENFMSGNSTLNTSGDAMSMLFQDNFWRFPTFPRIIFGTGHSLYGAKGYAHSDVGYVNEIWLFGILGCLLLYGKIIEMCGMMKKKTKIPVFEYAAVFLLISYFFFNIKCVTLGYNPGAVVMLFIIFVGTYQSRSYEQCRRKDGEFN